MWELHFLLVDISIRRQCTTKVLAQQARSVHNWRISSHCRALQYLKQKMTTAQAHSRRKSYDFSFPGWFRILTRAPRKVRTGGKRETSPYQIKMATDGWYTSHIEAVTQRTREISVPVDRLQLTCVWKWRMKFFLKTYKNAHPESTVFREPWGYFVFLL